MKIKNKFSESLNGWSSFHSISCSSSYQIAQCRPEVKGVFSNSKHNNSSPANGMEWISFPFQAILTKPAVKEPWIKWVSNPDRQNLWKDRTRRAEFTGWSNVKFFKWPLSWIGQSYSCVESKVKIEVYHVRLTSAVASHRQDDAVMEWQHHCLCVYIQVSVRQWLSANAA